MRIVQDYIAYSSLKNHLQILEEDQKLTSSKEDDIVVSIIKNIHEQSTEHLPLVVLHRLHQNISSMEGQGKSFYIREIVSDYQQDFKDIFKEVFADYKANYGKICHIIRRSEASDSIKNIASHLIDICRPD